MTGKTSRKRPPGIRVGNTRRPGLRDAGGLVERLTRPAVRARGMVRAEILIHWRAIVGDSLSRATFPVKYTPGRGPAPGGVLEVRTTGTAAVEISHRQIQLLERINTYFGYVAVTRLRLVQGPLPAIARPAVPGPPGEGEPSPTARARLDEIGDDALRTRLERLGRLIAGRRRGD